MKLKSDCYERGRSIGARGLSYASQLQGPRFDPDFGISVHVHDPNLFGFPQGSLLSKHAGRGTGYKNVRVGMMTWDGLASNPECIQVSQVK